VYRDGGLSRLDKPLPWYAQQNSSSLGGFYIQLCGLCGFDPIQGEEWKVMGLAPYGKVDTELYARLKAMVKIEDLNVVLGASLAEQRRNFDVLKSMRRPPKSPPIEAADMACTGQVVFCEAMRELLENLSRKGISKNLAFAGGCALNSSWNGEILRATSFERLHIPSAPADDGTSLGAALRAYYEDHPKSPPPRKVMTPYLGTGISAESLDHLARFSGFKRVRRSPGSVTRETAKLLAEGNIVGWMQGNAEFGPRALGHRSILADPRSLDMKDKINARVKFREEFRPFAPSILHEFGPEYFEDYQETPYMDRTLVFREAVRHKVAAVVHENGTGRLQTVKREWSEIYYQLIHDFYELTGVPVLLNTSFNVMGKPIIHSVEDAAAMFMTSGLDVLVIGDLIIEKEPAPSAL
jgi:carbamoyltransferase